MWAPCASERPQWEHGLARGGVRWARMEVRGPFSWFCFIILFSIPFPFSIFSIINSNLSSNFVTHHLYTIFVQLKVLSLNIIIYIYIIIFSYPFSFPYFQNPNFKLGFNLTSSIYYLIIISLIVLFNAQTYKLQQDALYFILVLFVLINPS
jgi:hypothetical protein